MSRDPRGLIIDTGRGRLMKTKTKKRKNPADTTMRNINALKKRIKALEDDIEFIYERITGIRCALIEHRK